MALFPLLAAHSRSVRLCREVLPDGNFVRWWVMAVFGVVVALTGRRCKTVEPVKQPFNPFIQHCLAVRIFHRRSLTLRGGMVFYPKTGFSTAFTSSPFFRSP